MLGPAPPIEKEPSPPASDGDGGNHGVNGLLRPQTVHCIPVDIRAPTASRMSRPIRLCPNVAELLPAPGGGYVSSRKQAAQPMS